MKTMYKNQLIKDIIVAGAAWLISTLLFTAIMEGNFIGSLMIGFFLSGIPFGWKFLSKIYIALSFQAIAIKAFLAILVGWVALPIVLIKDIITYKTCEA